MASLATQFIGVPAQINPNKASSTRDYQTAWNQYNLANTGNYTADDTIMVSGSGPWRGVTDQQIQETFETHYKPLLEKAVSAQASFLVGNAKGTDKLVINYLKESGYDLNQQDNYLSAKLQLNLNSLEQKNEKSAVNSNITDISNNQSLSNPSINIKQTTQIPAINFIDDSPLRPNYPYDDISTRLMQISLIASISFRQVLCRYL